MVTMKDIEQPHMKGCRYKDWEGWEQVDFSKNQWECRGCGATWDRGRAITRAVLEMLTDTK